MNRKFTLLFLAVLLIFSCTKTEVTITRIKPDTFIEEPGKYLLGSKQIWLKEFTDGTLLLQIGDDLNRKVLYQQSMFKAFSKYHQWVIYIDKGENIWCYNGDLQDHFVLLYEDDAKLYKVVDYLRADYLPPKRFTQKVEQ